MGLENHIPMNQQMLKAPVPANHARKHQAQQALEGVEREVSESLRSPHWPKRTTVHSQPPTPKLKLTLALETH